MAFWFLSMVVSLASSVGLMSCFLCCLAIHNGTKYESLREKITFWPSQRNLKRRKDSGTQVEYAMVLHIVVVTVYVLRTSWMRVFAYLVVRMYGRTARLENRVGRDSKIPMDRVKFRIKLGFRARNVVPAGPGSSVIGKRRS